MSLSPENYRGLEVECRELIANAQLLLSGKDSQQHQQAAVFIEDDMSLSNALSEKYQECIEDNLIILMIILRFAQEL